VTSKKGKGAAWMLIGVSVPSPGPSLLASLFSSCSFHSCNLRLTSAIFFFKKKKKKKKKKNVCGAPRNKTPALAGVNGWLRVC
jgi:hypothetical protein